MSVFDTNHPVPRGAVAALHTVSLFARALHAAASWRRARGTRNALLGLSDGQLADIGLHRGEIPEVAEALARR